MFPLIYDTKHISVECKKLSKEMKDYYDMTILENLYNSLNRESVKKSVIYMPCVKHSQQSFNYGKLPKKNSRILLAESISFVLH